MFKKLKPLKILLIGGYAGVLPLLVAVVLSAITETIFLISLPKLLTAAFPNSSPILFFDFNITGKIAASLLVIVVVMRFFISTATAKKVGEFTYERYLRIGSDVYRAIAQRGESLKNQEEAARAAIKDVDFLTHYLTYPTIAIINELTIAIMVLGGILVINAKFALFFMLVLAISFPVLKWSRKKQSSYSDQRVRSEMQLYKIGVDTIRERGLLVSCGSLELALKKIFSAMRCVSVAYASQYSIQNLARLLIESASIILIVLEIILLSTEYYDMTNVFVLVFMQIRLFMCASRIGGQYQSISFGTPVALKLIDIVESLNISAPSKGVGELLVESNAQYNFLLKKSGRTLNISGKRGDIIRVCGESGSGKSTFLRMLAREELQEGEERECYVNGIVYPLSNLKIPYLSQTTRPFNTTTLDNITLFSEEVIAQKVFTSKSLVGLGDGSFPDERLVDSELRTISGGEGQRLFAATLLYSDGNVAVIDEGFSNLPLRDEVSLISVLKEKYFVIYTTHKETHPDAKEVWING